MQQLHPATDAHLLEDVVDVGADRRKADVHPLGNLLVAQAAGYLLYHLRLPGGDPELPQKMVADLTVVDKSARPDQVPDKGRQGYMYLTPNLTPMWYMSAQTKYPKEAWKVLSFFYSTEYQQKFVANNFGYSPLKNFNNVKYTQFGPPG